MILEQKALKNNLFNLLIMKFNVIFSLTFKHLFHVNPLNLSIMNYSFYLVYEFEIYFISIYLKHFFENHLVFFQ
jgi:hypothetical protein